MKAKAVLIGGWILGLVLAPGCELDPYEGQECEPCDDGCPSGLACQGGRCIDPEHPDSCRSSLSLCDEYCEVVMEACPQDYVTRDTCLGVCTLLPEGDLNEASQTNTVACRLNAAKAAPAVSEREREVMCQAAGPGGGGVCGSNCESYCLLAEQACGDQLPSLRDCERACEALGDSNRYDATLDHAGDTVQCRLVHLSSATVEPEPHCGHAGLHATLWCVDEEPSCEAYCRITQAACQGDRAVYRSESECEAACALLDLGATDDDIQDTVGCRTWHAKSALFDPDNHCSHAGPTGDGHCGIDSDAGFAACAPYCRVVEAACPEHFAEVWDSSDECLESCNESDEAFGAAADQRYAVASAETSGATLGCRVAYAVGLLTQPDDPELCPMAFGAGACGD